MDQDWLHIKGGGHKLLWELDVGEKSVWVEQLTNSARRWNCFHVYRIAPHITIVGHLRGISPHIHAHYRSTLFLHSPTFGSLSLHFSAFHMLILSSTELVILFTAPIPPTLPSCFWWHQHHPINKSGVVVKRLLACTQSTVFESSLRTCQNQFCVEFYFLPRVRRRGGRWWWEHGGGVDR